MAKMMILVDPNKCTGCRLCELVCSVKNEGVSNPIKSRIQVVKWEEVGYYMVMVCQQCDDAACMAACPVDALWRDENGVVRLDKQRCIGCRLCVQACPFGAMGYNQDTGEVFKCEQCDGEPECVKFCEPQALQYVEASEANLRRRRNAAQRIADILKNVP